MIEEQELIEKIKHRIKFKKEMIEKYKEIGNEKLKEEIINEEEGKVLTLFEVINDIEDMIKED